MTATCSMTTVLLGHRTAPCWRTATHASTGRCERGHTRTRVICGRHAKAIASYAEAVFCEQCDDEGIETLMSVTITDPADPIAEEAQA